MISLAQAPKSKIAESMRDESHLTSDNWHVGSTLEHLLISVTLQHHKHKTSNIILFIQDRIKSPWKLRKRGISFSVRLLCSICSNPKHFTEKIPAAQVIYS